MDRKQLLWKLVPMLACIILEIADGTEVGNIYRIGVHPRNMTIVMVFFFYSASACA